MMVQILAPEGTETLDLIPGCEDFCDECGDCLRCFWEDPCRDGGGHSWVVYPESAAAFRVRKGLGSEQ